MQTTPPDFDYGENRRAHSRHKVLRSAAVVFNDRNSVVTGNVRNLCEAGAKFVVSFPVDLPQHVYLRFAADEEWKARLAWQKGGVEFGLQFIERRMVGQGLKP